MMFSLVMVDCPMYSQSLSTWKYFMLVMGLVIIYSSYSGTRGFGLGLGNGWALVVGQKSTNHSLPTQQAAKYTEFVKDQS